MISSKPKVSVIIPIYNASLYLHQTLESIRNQKFINFEVIMVDDGSTDESIKIAQNFSLIDPRFKLVNTSHNSGGPAGPRNLGIKLTNSKWIAFCDADDIWFPEKLNTQIKILEDYNVKLCAVNLIDFSQDKHIKIPKINKVSIKKITFLKMLFNSRIRISGVVVSRDLIKDIKFNENINYRAREDYDFWLQCHEIIHSSIKIMEPFGGYRVSDKQISGDKVLMIKRHYRVLKNYTMNSGKKIGKFSIIFTLTHFIMAFLKRKFLKTA